LDVDGVVGLVGRDLNDLFVIEHFHKGVITPDTIGESTKWVPKPEQTQYQKFCKFQKMIAFVTDEISNESPAQIAHIVL